MTPYSMYLMMSPVTACTRVLLYDLIPRWRYLERVEMMQPSATLWIATQTRAIENAISSKEASERIVADHTYVRAPWRRYRLDSELLGPVVVSPDLQPDL